MASRARSDATAQPLDFAAACFVNSERVTEESNLESEYWVPLR